MLIDNQKLEISENTCDFKVLNIIIFPYTLCKFVHTKHPNLVGLMITIFFFFFYILCLSSVQNV